jgi:diketogulonate reductase-like aldo/keto reductase
MVNQLEVHPYLPQTALVESCRARNIRCMAYCPFASGMTGLLEDPIVTSIGRVYGVGASTVVTAWHVQRGITPVPKSTKPNRIATNMTPPHFTLTASQMSAITALGDSNPYRVCPDPGKLL